MLNQITIGKKTLKNHPKPSYPRWIDKFLLKLGGRTDYGDPYLKLVWGQEERIYYCGEMRMKYLAASAIVQTGLHVNPISKILEPTFVRVDIGRQRFYLEEWWPPELLAKGWDTLEMGEFPKRGKWRSVFCLETADGKYREPDKECMSWVEEVWKKRQESRLTYDPKDEEPETLKAWAKARVEGDIEQAFQMRKQRIEDRLKSSILPHANRMIGVH